jgi:PAS domain S-box-containing protein
MKKTEELLQYINHLEAILDNLPFEVWTKDPDGDYLFVNEKLAKRIGKAKEEIIGKNVFDLFSEDDAKMFADSDKAVLAGENPDFYEMYWENDIYEEFKQPVFDASGHLVFTSGFSRNITQCKKESAELAERERDKSMLLSNMPGVAFRCDSDSDYTVTFISDSCFNLTGYTAEELLSMNPSYNDLIHPAYRKALIGKWDSDDKEDTISTDEFPITT